MSHTFFSNFFKFLLDVLNSFLFMNRFISVEFTTQFSLQNFLSKYIFGQKYVLLYSYFFWQSVLNRFITTSKCLNFLIHQYKFKRHITYYKAALLNVLFNNTELALYITCTVWIPSTPYSSPAKNIPPGVIP